MRNGNLIQLCSGRYYQGSGVLSHLGGDAVLLGRRALVVADAAVWPKVEARVLRSLEQSGVDTKIWLFSGHCCPGNVRSAAQAGQAYGAELVVGVGGGRALDTAKIAADHMGGAGDHRPHLCGYLRRLSVAGGRVHRRGRVRGEQLDPVPALCRDS